MTTSESSTRGTWKAVSRPSRSISCYPISVRTWSGRPRTGSRRSTQMCEEVYAMEIRQYKHGEGDFWQRMGPFLASAAVRRELGAPITSDETTTWWLAVDGDWTLGF